MDSGALNGRPELRKDAWGELKASLEQERMAGLLWRKERQGNLWGAAFFSPKACPEGNVNDRLNRVGIGFRG